MPATDPITLFSWGYWGWGNATPQLVEAVDAVEGARGFRPPLFVDIRIKRSVRAAGFRDNAFAEVAGPDRYRWMRALGNRSVETRAGPRIQIADPSAADALLDLALSAAEEGRRALFFCACEQPINDQGEECHRVTVARLVRDAAQRRGAALRLVEWPGGHPERLDLEVPASVLRAVQRGRASLPLADPEPLSRYAGLPWASAVRLHAGGEELVAAAGPARFASQLWVLPLLNVFTGREADPPEPSAWTARFRQQHGYEPVEASAQSRAAAARRTAPRR